MKKLLATFAILLLGLGNSRQTLAETLWIDVRSSTEYAADHIQGDIHIPHTDITAQIGQYTRDKNAEIRLYCRSGNRADMARTALANAGYTNVKNDGSIADARATRQLPACTRC